MTIDAEERMIQIIFRNMDHSDAVEQKIRDRIEKLHRFHDGLTTCRVVVEMHHRHHQQGNHYHVLVDAIVPGQELLTYNQPAKDKLFSDVYVAIREAFDAMDRKLKELGSHQRGEVKAHQA